MITSIILVGLGTCIGGAVAVALTSTKEDEINQRIKDARNEGVITTRNELNNIIKQKDMELKVLRESNNGVEIEEI